MDKCEIIDFNVVSKPFFLAFLKKKIVFGSGSGFFIANPGP